MNVGISVKGGSKKSEAKKPISPEKYGIIKGLFDERLCDLNLGESEEIRRIKRINYLIKSAINNINSSKCKQTEPCLHINEPIETAIPSDDRKKDN